ncbi:MAG: metalloregulator ArsR/SmtB family transcription factor [Chloroflexi bacterium]|nr:metalloregulator ArsR/SmtB family transcription factor [Chloroflexota bacterium]
MSKKDNRQATKAAVYEQLAKIGKALGSARRVEIIDLLAQAEHTVEHLADKTGLSVASVSQHLQVLKQANLVDVRREGTYAFYSLADKEVLDVWYGMTRLAQSRLLEIEHILNTNVPERKELAYISLEELVSRLEQDEVMLLDARPPDEYAAGHIPGALSMPSEATTIDLPAERDIVAYCRTSYCLLSDDLALYLKHRGYSVRRLQGGILDWQAAGLPIERSE